MIELLLMTIAGIGILQLLAILALVLAIHRDTTATQDLHTTVDNIQTGLVAARNQDARWKG